MCFQYCVSELSKCFNVSILLQACQNRVISWFQGQTVPSLRPSNSESSESSEDGSDEKSEENDADVAKNDLILVIDIPGKYHSE